MIKLRIAARIDATRDEVLEYMTSPDYLAAICSEAKEVSSGHVEVNERSGDTLTHAVRWVAPTRLPSILKKYQDKAPREVSWLEETVWDLERGEASLRIIPEVPDHWHSKYRSSGRVVLRDSAGGLELNQDLDFALDFGLVGKALEKLLKGEVQKLLEKRVAVLKARFER